MVDIRPNVLPAAILPLRSGDALIVDQGADGVRQTDPFSMTDSVAPVASQAEAVAGSDNTKRMTPLRTKQSIASEVGVTLASNTQGEKADSAVQSVNGKTGNSVTLLKSDVGLGNVDNTSDINKPISTAMQNALDTKANSSVTISAGTGLDGGGNLSANRAVSLNAASIASLAKADSSVQTVNGVSPTSGNVNVAGGIPDDNSVTDPKLPSYSDSLSPSSSKLRYQASTSAGALAGAVQRPVDLKLSDILNASDFGVKADGVTNDTAAMVAAFAAMEQTGRPLFLPDGVIMVDADALFIGNGAEGTNSSYNNQTIIGIGSSPAFASGSIIKSRTNGTCLFDIRGLVSGVSISGVTFDCDSKVQIGIRIRSMSESNIEQFSVMNFTLIGVDWNCRANPSASPTWSSGNVIKQFYITSSSVVSFGVGLLLDGQISTNKDPHRNTFHTGIIQINKAASNPTFAMLLAMTDSNTFIEVDADTIGTGVGFGVRFSALTSNGFPFPQNNFFYGCSIKGIDVAEDAGTGKLIGYNTLVNMTTMDGETLPTHPKILGFTDTGKFFNDITIDKDLPSVELRSRDGLKRYRLINNSNDSTDGGVLLQKWSTSTGAWVTYFAVDSAGTPAITLPGLGLKQIQAGDVDTGGTGFRRLVVSN